MNMRLRDSSEFDRYANNYEALVREPTRDWFGSPLFFHRRKLDLLLRVLASMHRDTRSMDWLDVGCGQGTLLALGKAHFRKACGCDPSAGMLDSCLVADVLVQSDPNTIPYPDSSMDLVTAVCVYHHIASSDRERLTNEIRRVLRPNGIFAIIEHNPNNPLTRLVVSRSPIDVNAVLLRAAEAGLLQEQAGMKPYATVFFLFVPSILYRLLGFIERMLVRIPLGGQYIQLAVIEK